MQWRAGIFVCVWGGVYVCICLDLLIEQWQAFPVNTNVCVTSAIFVRFISLLWAPCIFYVCVSFASKSMCPSLHSLYKCKAKSERKWIVTLPRKRALKLDKVWYIRTCSGCGCGSAASCCLLTDACEQTPVPLSDIAPFYSRINLLGFSKAEPNVFRINYSHAALQDPRSSASWACTVSSLVRRLFVSMWLDKGRGNMSFSRLGAIISTVCVSDQYTRSKEMLDSDNTAQPPLLWHPKHM